MTWIRNALDEDELAQLEAVCPSEATIGGRMPLGDYALSAALAPVTSIIAAHRPGLVPVRCVAFFKSDNANWSLGWHQDRVIAVAEKADVAGYTHWSCKLGQWHCEPPEDVLRQMVFTRVHLDPCYAENGAMEIAVGSAAAGLLRKSEIAKVLRQYRTEICRAERGDIQMLDMLTVHRSRPSQTNAPRRALRIDFADFDLPAPLRWAG